MPITAPYTDTQALANLVTAAYDRKVRLALRSIPTFRAVADTKPVQQTHPGSSIVFNIHNDLSPATTPLDEVADPTGVYANETTPVTVTLREYGNFTVVTKALREFALDSNLDGNLSSIIAFNQVDSIDRVVEAVLAGCTNVITEEGGDLVATSNDIDNVLGDDYFKARDARYAKVKMNAASVTPVDGNNFVAYIHPEVSVDLRTETGPQGWREPQVYGAGDGLTGVITGEVGTFEGVRYIETPRCSTVMNGETPDVKVYNTYVFGREALAEAVADEFHVVTDGVIVDPLRRKSVMGWTGMAGWSLFRPESLWVIKTASSVA